MGKSKRKKRREKRLRGPTRRRDVAAIAQASPVPAYQKFAFPIVIVITIIAFSLHLYGADYSRRSGALTFDETLYARLGFQIKNGMGYGTDRIYNEQLKLGRKLPDYVNKPLFKHPPVFASLISMSYYVFLEKRDSYQMAELYQSASKVSNLMGCLLIILVFFLGKKFYDERTGFLAALLLALDFNLWNCSQKNWMETTLVFFLWLTLLFLMKGIENRKFFYLAGMVGGIAMLTKYPAVLVYLIFFTYIVIYERQVFRQKEFYGCLFITGLMLLPWFYANYRHYGSEFLEKMLYSGGGYQERILMFSKWTAGGAVIVAVMALFRKVRQRVLAGFHSVQNQLPLLFSFILAVLLGLLILQTPFRESILKSLSWGGSPRHGWQMGMFQTEPWYFYLKQHVEYSPFYLIFLVALIRVPLEHKYDKLLFFACFWILCFATLWKNFQGRYALSFVPAAVLLTARTMIDGFLWLWYKKSWIGKVTFYASLMVVVYFLAKTIRIDYLYALNGNSAYF